jgi:hypothetical protein
MMPSKKNAKAARSFVTDTTPSPNADERMVYSSIGVAPIASLQLSLLDRYEHVVHPGQLTEERYVVEY